MFSIAAAVIGLLLIILERAGKLKLQDLRTARKAMVLAALSAGFYLTDAARIIAAIGSKLMDYKTENPGEAMFFGSGSKVMVVIRSILLILSTVPAAAGLIYTVQALVRKTCDRTPAENDSGYVKERVTGLLARGSSAAVGMIISIIVLIVSTLPYLGRFIGTLVIFNPFFLLFFTLLTCGLVLIPVSLVFVTFNGVFIVLVGGIGTVAVVFYIISVIMCIAAAVTAAKRGAMTKKNAVIYSIFGLLPGWNLIAMRLMKKDI